MKEISLYRQLAQLSFLPIYIRLIRGAMELDVFSRLTEQKSAETLAEEASWNTENTRVLLDSLCSVGFLEKTGDSYVNTEEGARYLVSSSPEYAAGFLQMYMQEGMMSMDVAKLVREGPDPASMGQIDQSLDFTQYGDSFRAAQRGCRQQEVLRIVRALPENRRIRKILDIGCNTGLLGLALIDDEPGRSGVLFDMPPLCPLIDESIRQMGLSERARSRGGNFLTDDLGKDYDLILAVSVMLFAKGDMTAFLRKLYDALAPGGAVLCIGEGIREDCPAPWDMIMGYLSYRFQGMDMAVRSGEIEAAAKAAGFRETETRTELLCSGTQDIIVLRK
ncbi:MAG: class I SAM-dependent methyltransferase [Oscillospiraceae bacterium]|nr:class I SAM-dependent methyltransferase [Oscillospiraceae bacterium]